MPKKQCNSYCSNLLRGCLYTSFANSVSQKLYLIFSKLTLSQVNVISADSSLHITVINRSSCSLQTALNTKTSSILADYTLQSLQNIWQAFLKYLVTPEGDGLWHMSSVCLFIHSLFSLGVIRIGSRLTSCDVTVFALQRGTLVLLRRIDFVGPMYLHKLV